MEREKGWEMLLSQLRESFVALEKENLALKNENQALQARFDRMLFQQTIAALLKPDHSTEALSILCAQAGIPDPDGAFVILEFSNDEVLGRENRVPHSPFDDPEVQELLTRIAAHFRGPDCHAVTAPQGDRIVCILCMPAAVSWQEARAYIAAHVQSLPLALDNLPLFAAVSQLVQGAGLLPEAFAAVRQVADYKAVMEDYTQALLFASDLALQSRPSGTETVVPTAQRRFVFLLRIGSFVEAQAEARALIDVKLLRNPSIHTLPLAMASVKDIFIHTIGSTCIELKLYEDYERLNIVQRVAEAATIQELQTQLDQVLEGLQDAFAKCNPEVSLPWRMQAYIDENYWDPDLNVNAVANYFSITPSHATKIFRPLHADGILSYIHERRLFAAKELLGSGQSISEIAKHTGYRTSANMIRAFKRAEGVTPGQLAAQDRHDPES